MKRQNSTLYKITFTGLLAALVCVVTFLRFPLFGSKVHFGNAMCLLSGLLLGPVWGGVAAGLGSLLNDLFSGYGLECLVTFVSKFAMAAVCALLAKPTDEPLHKARLILGSILGALSYVVLYMLKTYLFQQFLYGFPMDAVWATMLAKLPASLINAAFAAVVTPLFFAAVRTALKNAGLFEKLQ